MVSRVWPRHGHRGRPLNSVVRHQTMSSLATICIWAVVAGLVAGAVLHAKVPSELRARVERTTLRWGVIGVVLMSGPFAVMKHTVANRSAEIALGLTVAIPLVTGVVLYILGKRERSGV